MKHSLNDNADSGANSYVTLITNEDYVLGARALARSLRMCQSEWKLTALVLEDLPGLNDLEALGCTVLQVDELPLSTSFQERHSRKAQHAQAPFTKGNKPVFHNPLHNFVKLRLWELEQFERVVFLDADTLVIQNIDRLFGYPEFAAAPNLYESLSDFHRLNSGVFVAQPSRRTFDHMLETLDRPDVFWSRTDQTFLQSYFPDWHGLPYIYNTLQYVWFNLPELWNWDFIRVIHYQYEKPWEDPHPKQELLQPMIDTWWSVFENGRLPADLPQAAGVPA
ncbi:MAG TPA: glycosyltransferase family 8 protein [Phototrophicaceae bacterium]|jgi:alpha-N-acetylglucosamine transferase|nr:glycosyltransferase family 8 protein [Phototrophicaceae bacterium]